MGKKISFNADGLILAKEYEKPRDSWVDKTGKTIEKKAESFVIYVAFGNVSNKSNLFICKPELARATVTKQSFLNLKSQSSCNCFVRHKNEMYEILKINGFDIVGVDLGEDDIGDEYDEDADSLLEGVN